MPDIPKRIAFVLNALTGKELAAGNRDVSIIYNVLTDPLLGMCVGTKPIHECKSRQEFENDFLAVLENWCVTNQLIFYFSGHGTIRGSGNSYSLQVGSSSRDFYPFQNIINELDAYHVYRAILIIDACHSGAALNGFKEKNEKNIFVGINDGQLPKGIAIIASSQASETSHELPDGSASVFTDLLCEGIQSGLGGNYTPDGLISVGDLVTYINSKLQTDEKYIAFRQKAVFETKYADRDIWIAKNKSGSAPPPKPIPQSVPVVHSPDELKLLFEKTLPHQHPCINASIDELDWELVRKYADKVNPGISEKDHSQEKLLSLLKFYSPIFLEGKNHLHQSAVLCFYQHPEILFPQARSVLGAGEPYKQDFIREDVAGPLSVQIQSLIELTRRYDQPISYIAEDGLRYTIEPFDLNVVRELISNAIAHRDYKLNGTVKVTITRDTFEVQNPGNFPKDWSWDGFMKSPTTVSCPVDSAIALYLTHLVAFEGIGRGFGVFRQYLKAHGENSIVCRVLPGPIISIQIIRKNQQHIALQPLRITEKEGHSDRKDDQFQRPGASFRKTILVLAANPKDTARLRIEEEVREIEERLQLAQHRDHFQVISKWAVRPKDLRKALLDARPQIVHFSGHGKTDGLELEDEMGKARLVSPGTLAGLFDLCKETIECVILNACYSETQANAISQHIPHVIGMKQAIGDKAAREFSIGFYDAVGAGETYQKAFEFGRNAINLAGIPEHLIPLLKQHEETKTHSAIREIEFVNREKELQYITSIHAPQYLLISAPKGYGKTRLIDSVKAKLQEQALCLHFSLLREQDYTVQDLAIMVLEHIEQEIPEVLDLQIAADEVIAWIGDNIQTQHRQVIFFIDGAEALPEVTAKAFFNEFIPDLSKGLKETKPLFKVRVICAGRYIAHWEQYGSQIRLKAVSLTPFEFSAVHQMVEEYDSENKFTPEYRKNFAAHLMYFTGGHPGCMATILTQDFKIPTTRLLAREEEYYEFVVLPVIEKINAPVSDKLKPIFETLSIVRRFNARFLRRCLDQQLIISAGNDEYTLENRLIKTFVINKTNGFLCDDMSRRLLSIYLRKTNLPHYLKVCQEALAFYQDGLQTGKSFAPVVFAIELLFQRMHYLVYSKQGGKEEFLKSIPEVLDMLVKERYAQDVLDAFIEQLDNDWEFKFLFNYLFRGEQYDELLFEDVYKQVTRFQDTLK